MHAKKSVLHAKKSVLHAKKSVLHAKNSVLLDNAIISNGILAIQTQNLEDNINVTLYLFRSRL